MFPQRLPGLLMGGGVASSRVLGGLGVLHFNAGAWRGLWPTGMWVVAVTMPSVVVLIIVHKCSQSDVTDTVWEKLFWSWGLWTIEKRLSGASASLMLWETPATSLLIWKKTATFKRWIPVEQQQHVLPLKASFLSVRSFLFQQLTQAPCQKQGCGSAGLSCLQTTPARGR